MKVLEAEFLTSAARATDVPADAMPQLALVGRSNVGKSSLINALAGRRIARTSATPGKTRLVNLYRVVLAGWPAAGRTGAHRTKAGTVFLADVPGYGYARGSRDARAEFARVAGEYFARVRARADTPGRAADAGAGSATDSGRVRLQPDDAADRRGRPDRFPAAVLLVVDARHPGLDTDREAWRWIRSLDLAAAVVATKSDKLGRAELTRALGRIERECDSDVTAVSAETGAGMDDLWKRIATLLNDRLEATGGTGATGAARPRSGSRR